MTDADADKLHAQIQAMSFEQIRLLMRWIYLEFGRRCEQYVKKGFKE